jgi:hypothetical protein
MKIRKLLVIVFILIILCLLFMSRFFHSEIDYIKFDKKDNKTIVSDWFWNQPGDYYMYLDFPDILQTLFDTSVSLETRDQKANLIECELFACSSNKDVNFNIKKMILLITDFKTNKVINVKEIEIYLNDEFVTANNKYGQIDFNINKYSKNNGFYHILYHYDDFTNKINNIKLNFVIEWEYDNKSYSYSNEYLLKKKWGGFGFNICLD